MLVSEGASPISSTGDKGQKISNAAVVRRLNLRVLIFCTVLPLLCGINHYNVGFAANDLCKDLQLTNSQYGIGIAASYGGLTLFQPIGNEFLKFLGGPAWFALILLIWGAAGVGLGFVRSAFEFYGLMALLGSAQGGVYPGILYYLCLFYPPRYLASAFAAVTAAGSFAIPATSILSAAVVALADAIGWAAWRTIFVGMGALPVFFSVIIYFALPVSPDEASFLTQEEKHWIEVETGRDDTTEQSMSFVQEVKHVMSSVQVQIAALAALCSFGVETVLMFFVNLIIRTALNGPDDNEETCGTAGGNQMTAIVLTGLPYLCSGFGCLLMGRYAERIHNKKRFAVVMQLASGGLLAAWGPLNAITFATGFIALTSSVVCAFPPQVVVYSLAATNVVPSARSTALAYISSIFSVSGLVFPLLVGEMLDVFGYKWSVSGAGFLGVIAGLLMTLMRDPQRDIEDVRPQTTMS